MSAPLELPANALADARALLLGELVAVFARVGWEPERARELPLLPVPVPGGWVDVPTVSTQGQGTVATFPIIVAVDGAHAEQVKRLDAITAALWERLYAFRIPDDAPRLPRGSTLQLLTAGLDDLDLGSANARAVTLTVQIPLAPRTLCPTALTEPDTGEPTP
jgi:hypothetical protein